jgi:hypothetical protein
MKQKLIELKGKNEKSILTVRNVNAPFSIIDRTSSQKINKGAEVWTLN